MRRGASFTACGLFAVAVIGACVQPVLLGYSDAGAQDSGPDAAPGLCLQNPGLRGSPTDDGGMPRDSRTTKLLPGWQKCDGTPDINPGVCSLLPPLGTSAYLGLDVGGFQGAGTIVSTSLNSSVPPGSYPFSIDLAQAVRTLPWVASSTQVELRIYGSAVPCGRDEELASVPVTNVDVWMTYSPTLMAQQTFSNLVLVPSLLNAPGGSSPRPEAYLVIGNLQSSTCH